MGGAPSAQRGDNSERPLGSRQAAGDTAVQRRRQITSGPDVLTDRLAVFTGSGLAGICCVITSAPLVATPDRSSYCYFIIISTLVVLLVFVPLCSGTEQSSDCPSLLFQPLLVSCACLFFFFSYVLITINDF